MAISQDRAAFDSPARAAPLPGVFSRPCESLPAASLATPSLCAHSEVSRTITDTEASSCSINSASTHLKLDGSEHSGIASRHTDARERVETLLRRPPRAGTALWRLGDEAPAGYRTVSSGHTELDEQLPGSGWPIGGLTEIVVERQGIGELQLVLPALSALSLQGQAIVWVAPPFVPYAPSLEAYGLDLGQLLWIRRATLNDRLWAAEQALRSGACGAVLLWLAPEHAAQVKPKALRRLQLAAEQGKSLALSFWRRAPEVSPAVLRLAVSAAAQTQDRYAPRVSVALLKCRGRGVGCRLELNLALGSARS